MLKELDRKTQYGIAAIIVVIALIAVCAVVFIGNDDDDRSEPVAEYGGNTYNSISDALANVSSSESTIILIADNTEDIVIPESAVVVLDLNGHTLTGKGSTTITNNGTLSIIGAGTVRSATTGGNVITNNGDLTVSDCTVSNQETTAKRMFLGAIVIDSTIVNLRNAHLRGGTYLSTHSVIEARSGTVDIDGGAFDSRSGDFVYSTGGKVVVKSGTFSDSLTDDVKNYTTGSLVETSDGTFIVGYTVTIAGEGLTVKNGENTVSDGDKVAYGTVLTVSIADKTGYTGSVSASVGSIIEGKCTVTDNVVLTGEYTALKYTVTIEGEGVIILDGETKVSSGDKVDYGTVLTVSIEDKIGYTGSVSASVGTITDGKYTVTENVVLTGVYAALKYAVTIEGEGVTVLNGETKVSSGDKVDYSSVLTVTVESKEHAFALLTVIINGETIGPVSAPSVGTSLTLSFTVVSEITLKGSYEGETFTVTADSDVLIKNGETVVSSGDKVAYGTILTVSAVEKEGYVGSIAADKGEVKDGKFTVTDNVVFSSSYLQLFTVTYDSEGLTVMVGETVVPSGTALADGTVLSLKIEEKEHYEPALSVTIGSVVVVVTVESGTNPVFTLSADTAYSVAYVPLKYTVTYSGEVTVMNGETAVLTGDKIEYGTVLSIVLPAKEHKVGTISITGSPDVFSAAGKVLSIKRAVLSDTVITAVYSDELLRLDFDSAQVAVFSDSDMKESVATGAKAVYGADVFVKSALPEKEGYAIRLLANGAAISEGKYHVTENTTFTSEYIALFTVTYGEGISVYSDEGKTKEITSGTTVISGTKIWISAEPKEHYSVSVTIGGETVTDLGGYEVLANTVIAAVYVGNPCTLTIDDNVVIEYEGKAVVSGSTVPYGSTVEVSAVEKTGHVGTVAASSGTIEEGSYLVVGDASFTASYVPVDYVVTFEEGISVSIDGTAVASGSKVAYGTVLTVTATEKTGHVASAVPSVGTMTDGKYTVIGDVEFTLSYTPVEYAITFGENVTVKNGENVVTSGDKLAYGTVLTVASVAKTGYTGAVVASIGSVADGKYTVVGEAELTVEYTPLEYTVTISGEGLTVKNGDATVASGDKIAYGTVLTVTLTGKANYQGTISFTGSPDVFSRGTDLTTKNTVLSETVITGTYTPLKYAVTIIGEGVSVMDGENAVSSGDKVAYGTVLTVSIADKEGYTVSVTASTGTITEGKYTVTGKVTFTGVYTVL